MTTISNAQIPVLTRLEQHFAWSGCALYDLHSNSLYKESELTGLVPRFSAQIGVAADKSEYLIIRGSIPMPSDWRTASQPLYKLAQEIANAPIPGGYLPNP